MAVKKEAEVVEDIKVAKPVKEKDAWAVMKTIKLDKALPGEENYVIASVNGRVFKIKKGIPVEVPAPIAEVLEHSMQAEEAKDMFIESKAN